MSFNSFTFSSASDIVHFAVIEIFDRLPMLVTCTNENTKIINSSTLVMRIDKHGSIKYDI